VISLWFAIRMRRRQSWLAKDISGKEVCCAAERLRNREQLEALIRKGKSAAQRPAEGTDIVEGRSVVGKPVKAWSDNRIIKALETTRLDCLPGPGSKLVGREGFEAVLSRKATGDTGGCTGFLTAEKEAKLICAGLVPNLPRGNARALDLAACLEKKVVELQIVDRA